MSLGTGCTSFFAGLRRATRRRCSELIMHTGTNRFWKTLDEVGLTSGQLEPSEYQRLQQFGIGLTDLCKTDGGNDDEIPKGALNVADLAENIKRFEPRSALTASGRRRKVSYVASGSEDIDL